ncbi:hypothetical protein [Mucilaginibacter pallidiroseus]|nr:hypothetical protein [Mucilaginibacter pallidiroseus]
MPMHIGISHADMPVWWDAETSSSLPAAKYIKKGPLTAGLCN